MRFHPPLEEGRLIRRYKRFLADIETVSGELMTIHCPNTGSMLNCQVEGGQVWFSRSNDPQAQVARYLGSRRNPAGALVLREHRASQRLDRRSVASGCHH